MDDRSTLAHHPSGSPVHTRPPHPRTIQAAFHTIPNPSTSNLHHDSPPTEYPHHLSFVSSKQETFPKSLCPKNPNEPLPATQIPRMHQLAHMRICTLHACCRKPLLELSRQKKKLWLPSWEKFWPIRAPEIANSAQLAVAILFLKNRD